MGNNLLYRWAGVVLAVVLVTAATKADTPSQRAAGSAAEVSDPAGPAAEGGSALRGNIDPLWHWRALEATPPGVDFALSNAPQFTAEEYPTTDGSTSAQPLAAIVAYRLLDIPYCWARRPSVFNAQPHRLIVPSAIATWRLDGRPRAQAAVLSENARSEADHLARRLVHTGTHDAYVNVINGERELAFICRLPSEDEQKLADEKGVTLEIEPVAMDAFVFIVNSGSPITGLTIQQARDIFSGRVTNWQEVGGPDSPISAYRRERNSGSQELMDALVMKDVPMAENLRDMTVMGMGGPFNVLAGDRRGVSYTVYYYQMFMAMPTAGRGGEIIIVDADGGTPAPPTIRTIAIEGVEPNAETIGSGEYPLTAPVYLVMRRDVPAGAPARALGDWLLTGDGQALVAATGYVPFIKPPAD